MALELSKKTYERKAVSDSSPPKGLQSTSRNGSNRAVNPVKTWKRHIEKVDECLREASKYIRNLAWDGEWSMGFLVQETAVAILGHSGPPSDARDRRVSQSTNSLMNNALLY